MRFFVSGLVAGFCLVASGSALALDTSAAQAAAPVLPSIDAAPVGQLPVGISPLSYDLHLTIDPTSDEFQGVVSIKVDLEKSMQGFWLHGENLVVDAASLELDDGTKIAASYKESAEPGVSLVTLASVAGPGTGTLHFRYHAPFNQSLDGLYQVKRDEQSYIVSQFEAIAARKAFPGFDEPRFKVPFSLTVTAPKDNAVITNTPQTKATELGNMIRYEFADTKPLPTYLLAFAVGPYDVNTWEAIPTNAVRDRVVPLRGVATKGSGSQLAYALQNTAGIVAVQEDYFGIAYPYAKLDLIAAPDYAFGAMENPGAIVFTEFLLLMDEESSLRQKRAYASVNSHELAHQWFGDLVTPKWWTDIWLNEAFATWMGNKTLGIWDPKGEFERATLRGALGAMNMDALANARQIHEPVKRNAEIWDAFDGITYRKGAGVLAMIESYVGEKAFQSGVREHMKRFAFKTATAEDFFTSLGEGSGHPEITSSLTSFVDQPYVPRVKVTLKTSDHKTVLQLSQSTYLPLGSKIANTGQWEIPFCASGMADGKPFKTCTMIKDKQQILTLDSKQAPAYVMPNANGAGYYRFSLDEDGWDKLIAVADTLPATEALSLRDSASAALNAGEMSADLWFDLMEKLTSHPAWDVVSAASGSIAGLRGRAVKRDDPALAAYVLRVFGPRYNNIKGDGPSATLLRSTLKRRLAMGGKDPAIREPLVAAAMQFVKLADDDSDAPALAPSDMGMAFSAAVQDKGKPFVEALKTLLETERNPAVRGAALGALSATNDPVLAADLRQWALGETVTGREALGVIRGQMGGDMADEGWHWFKENFDAVLSRMPDVRKSAAPNFGRGFCDADKAQAVQTFFTANADKIPGYERPLAQTLEGIALCAAFKKAKAKELADALASRG
ncbi:Membrane alanine aminopeptidase N [hydrothermal vent metagenome]|uniref:Membrane alanine aminopeptidase N n=1 Tax=hydrothermal vent metagenome TaxID=652676 RepID=A0A3B0RXS4_9ZZZZ